MDLIEQLAKDKTWQETKSKTNIETDKLLTKVEFLKSVGHEMFSEQAYKEYKVKWQELKNKMKI